MGNLKKCSKCKYDLPATDKYFASRHDRKEKQLQSICRTCQAEYRKEHYGLNRQKYLDKAKKYKKDINQWFIDFKSKLKCEFCNESRHWLLEFHHPDPSKKEGEVADFVNNQSKEKALKEIEKCKVLCCNCHRDLHYQMRQSPNGNGTALPTQNDVSSTLT